MHPYRRIGQVIQAVALFSLASVSAALTMLLLYRWGPAALLVGLLREGRVTMVMAGGIGVWSSAAGYACAKLKVAFLPVVVLALVAALPLACWMTFLVYVDRTSPGVAVSVRGLSAASSQWEPWIAALLCSVGAGSSWQLGRRSMSTRAT
jgi:hypothetical protein